MVPFRRAPVEGRHAIELIAESDLNPRLGRRGYHDLLMAPVDPTHVRHSCGPFNERSVL